MGIKYHFFGLSNYEGKLLGAETFSRSLNGNVHRQPLIEFSHPVLNDVDGHNEQHLLGLRHSQEDFDEGDHLDALAKTHAETRNT